MYTCQYLADNYQGIASGVITPQSDDIKQYCEGLLSIPNMAHKIVAYRCVERGKMRPIPGLAQHYTWYVSLLCLIDGIKYLDNYIICRLPARVDISTGQRELWSVEEALAEFPPRNFC